MVRKNDLGEFEFRVLRSEALSSGDREIVSGLFEVAYRQANHAYLDRSLGRLRFLALATHRGRPAGFALADRRWLELPRCAEPQLVNLGGIACVASEFRRRGLFGHLEELAAAAGETGHPTRVLRCGRMAHPASFRGLSRNPSAVPRPGVTPSAWQQEVGLAIAEAYGSRVDPETFVCLGDGIPVGYPRMEIDATEEEWELFRHVDRDRGDSLLGIAWAPSSPDGW